MRVLSHKCSIHLPMYFTLEPLRLNKVDAISKMDLVTLFVPFWWLCLSNSTHSFLPFFLSLRQENEPEIMTYPRDVGDSICISSSLRSPVIARFQKDSVHFEKRYGLLSRSPRRKTRNSRIQVDILHSVSEGKMKLTINRWQWTLLSWSGRLQP